MPTACAPCPANNNAVLLINFYNEGTKFNAKARRCKENFPFVSLRLIHRR